jgi:sugar/nucleoside kinase (ribokinase family)
MSYDHLIKFLQSESAQKSVVILPDFFVDHFVVASDFNNFFSSMKQLASQGGGNLLGTRHIIHRGGNSINTASALLTLGMKPIPIVTTDSPGFKLLKLLVDPTLNLNHVHTDGRLASTVSIELTYEERPVNLMVSDSGSVADFSYAELTEADLAVLKQSELVALLCLNHNRHGADLANDVFSLTKSEGQGLTFMDTGDPSGNPDLISGLIENVLSEGLVDILSVNENEIGWFAATLADDHSQWKPGKLKSMEWLKAAEYVASKLPVQIELHTPLYSASLVEDSIISVSAFEVKPQITCGAGDAWNAGNIFGLINGLTGEERLVLANALAALYISSEDATHPTKEQISSFLHSSPQLSISGKNLLIDR